MKKEGNRNNSNEGKNFVEITVNNEKFKIHRGRQSVETIKNTAGVLLTDILEQVIDGRLTPLPNDGFVVIKGGEVFVSHVPSGGAS